MGLPAGQAGLPAGQAGTAQEAAAQQGENKQEVVTLKNGRQVRGKIVSYAPLDSVVIREDDGTQQTIYWDRIRQITKDKWRPQRQKLGSGFVPGAGPQRGYRGFVDMEYYVSVDQLSRSHYGFSTAHGYQLKPFLFVGVGAGLKVSHKKHLGPPTGKKPDTNKLKDFYMFPVFGDIRFDVLRSKYTPFIDCRVGYTFGNKAFGMMFNPSLGCRVGIAGRLAINASLGYSLQSMDLVGGWADLDLMNNALYIWHIKGGNAQNSPYDCLSFKVGVEF